jgi:transcriptional regulator with XRE-family HTH domain
MTTRIDLSLHTMFEFEQNPFKNQNLPLYPFSISRDENRQPQEDLALAKEEEVKLQPETSSAFLITESRLDMPENERAKQSPSLIFNTDLIVPLEKIRAVYHHQTSGDLLRTFRKQCTPPGARRLSQKELGRRTGIGVDKISLYETGNPIEERDKVTFAQFFNVPVSIFSPLTDRSVLATKKLFADRLYKLRVHHKPDPPILSQKTLASQTGIPASTLSEYERGKQWISKPHKVVLAQFFNVSPSLFSSPKPLPTEPQVIAGDDRRVTGKKRGRSTEPLH